MSDDVDAEQEKITKPEVRRRRDRSDAVTALYFVGCADGVFTALVHASVVLPPVLTIGRGEKPRDPTSGRVSLNDERLSRNHLRLSCVQGMYQAEDLGSLNGTWLDGRLIGEAVRLSDGAGLFFGSSASVVRTVTIGERASIN